jgi:hypothetical protein
MNASSITINRLAFLWIGFLFFKVILYSCASAQAEARHVCRRVAIDSVKDDVGIWEDRIKGLARRAGLAGPAPFVAIVPPPQSGEQDRIRLMLVWWDFGEDNPGACEAGPDLTQQPAVKCAQNVPGTSLQLAVNFEPEGSHEPLERTNELVKYVLNEVLCTAQ